MADTASVIDVNIVAENRPLWNGQAKSAIVPSLNGYMGILADHEPVLAIVGNGNVTIKTVDGEEHAFAVEGGFISFEDNTLTIGVDKVLD
ncbi:F0F1 ATP synthase subunit epsilon [Alloscardovia venturai]|uniref:F0F1 ATP synthase subunit epsilon n=1 Tax=Alloscardovia venturai TaxID=1769421 RepID=A0ABW2Y895_9BIFI